jgi:hypothetical protein
MTYQLLLVSLPSCLPCLRQHILDIAPGVCFLGNPARRRLRLIPAPLLTSAESVRRVTPFLMLVLRRFRVVLFTGFEGVNPGRAYNRQAPILYLFGQADNLRRLVLGNDDSNAHSLALPMVTCSQGFPDRVSGLPITCFSPRFTD